MSSKFRAVSRPSVRRPLSLSLRLSLLFGIAAAGILVVFGWVISRSTEMHFEAADTSELEIITDTVILALTSAASKKDLARIKGRFDDILVGHHSASLYIVEAEQGLIYASSGPDLSSLVNLRDHLSGDGTLRTWTVGSHRYRVLIRSIDTDNQPTKRRYTVAVAVPMDFHLQFFDAFRRTLWLTILACIAIMSLVGWIVARRGHAPLRDIVDRMRQISANELDNRLLPETMPNELVDLAVSFNDMLERVDDAFQRLSDFSSNIAHEIRTPVTNLMTQAQVALTRSRSTDEHREILYSNIEEYERIAQMIGDMLFMAKADHGLQQEETTRIDIASEVQELFDYYDGWAEERGVSLTLEGAAIVVGDRRMLRRALGNLLSNAIRHTPSGKAVRVVLGLLQESISIAIENPGDEIPADHFPKLFDRFHRVDPSRQRDGDGAGLGLAIVKSIVDAHCGVIEVSSSGGLTRFEILLPGS